MQKKLRLISFFAVFIFFIGAFAQERELSLTLDECILRAMKNNLNVAVQVLNPELADISVSLAKENFLPNLSLRYDLRDTNQPSASFLEAENVYSEDFNAYFVSISQLIPTGGSFSISLGSSKTESNQRFQTLNPSYGSSLVFNFSQPLLRDFGFKISRREILIARHNSDISVNQFRGILMNTIYDVVSAYWNLVYSIENLKVQKQSLKLAEDLLAKNKREVEVGMLAPIEILAAQSEVATREADILHAEAEVKNNEDLLKKIINLETEDLKGELRIVPADEPNIQVEEVSLEEALTTALENRPDLQATKIEIKSNELDLSYAKNQLLPQLSLNARYTSPGLSGTQIIYDPNDPFGPPMDIIQRQASEAMKDSLGFEYKNWWLWVTFSLPLNTVLSRAQQAQARISLNQAMLRLKDQEQQVFLEVKNAVRSVETNYKRAQAYRVARELAEKKLEAEQKKLKVGLTTNYSVLLHQRDLANARSTELRALIDYHLSLADLDRVMGISLKKKNISLYDFPR